MKYIADVSGGKDSLAQTLMIVEKGEPLDEVVFYDTGMEFDAIYRIFDKLVPFLRERGVRYTTLHPENPFIYDMLERPVESEQKGKHNGYGWCGGKCRWGTTRKTEALDKYAAGAVQYIGIAADEQHRRKELTGTKRSILIEDGTIEADCLTFCRNRGYNWNEETKATKSGYIDLYDILDRVSCYCCANKNLKELWNIWKYLPQYWEKLIRFQEQLERPMKQYKCQQYGEYGNVLKLDEIFRQEERRPTEFTKKYLSRGEK